MQFPKLLLPKGYVRPLVVPQAAIGAKRCGYDWIGAERLLEKLHSWEVSTWENTFGKFPLQKKNTLGKYLIFKSREMIVKLPHYFPFFQCQSLALCLKINYVFELVYSTQLLF